MSSASRQQNDEENNGGNNSNDININRKAWLHFRQMNENANAIAHLT